jgi:hypothetical protein
MWKKLTLGHVIIFILLLGVGYSIWREKILSNNARFTIGITGEITWTVASGRLISYQYSVNGKSYCRSWNYINGAITNNCKCRYFVQYDYKNPNHSKLLQDKPVPDSIKSAPPKGWSKIPGE